AIRSAVEEERRPSAPLDVLERDLPEPQLGGAAYETELARMLREGEWVTSVELDPPKGGTYDAMLAVARTLKDSGLVDFVDFNGKGIDAPTSFFLGVAVNPSADDLETELDRFRQKVEAGAGFAMTQALFDLSYLDRFEELLGGWPIPLLVGIFYVRSHQLAVRLHNEVPGIVVPEGVQRRLERAGSSAGAEGLALARERYAEAREKAAGVYRIPPFKQPEAALDLLD